MEFDSDSEECVVEKYGVEAIQEMIAGCDYRVTVSSNQPKLIEEFEKAGYRMVDGPQYHNGEPECVVEKYGVEAIQEMIAGCDYRVTVSSNQPKLIEEFEKAGYRMIDGPQYPYDANEGTAGRGPGLGGRLEKPVTRTRMDKRSKLGVNSIRIVNERSDAAGDRRDWFDMVVQDTTTIANVKATILAEWGVATNMQSLWLQREGDRYGRMFTCGDSTLLKDAKARPGQIGEAVLLRHVTKTSNLEVKGPNPMRWFWPMDVVRHWLQGTGHTLWRVLFTGTDLYDVTDPEDSEMAPYFEMQICPKYFPGKLKEQVLLQFDRVKFGEDVRSYRIQHGKRHRGYFMDRILIEVHPKEVYTTIDLVDPRPALETQSTTTQHNISRNHAGGRMGTDGFEVDASSGRESGTQQQNALKSQKRDWQVMPQGEGEQSTIWVIRKNLWRRPVDDGLDPPVYPLMTEHEIPSVSHANTTRFDLTYAMDNTKSPLRLPLALGDLFGSLAVCITAELLAPQGTVVRHPWVRLVWGCFGFASLLFPEKLAQVSQQARVCVREAVGWVSEQLPPPAMGAVEWVSAWGQQWARACVTAAVAWVWVSAWVPKWARACATAAAAWALWKPEEAWACVTEAVAWVWLCVAGTKQEREAASTVDLRVTLGLLKLQLRKTDVRCNTSELKPIEEVDNLRMSYRERKMRADIAMIRFEENGIWLGGMGGLILLGTVYYLVYGVPARIAADLKGVSDKVMLWLEAVQEKGV